MTKEKLENREIKPHEALDFDFALLVAAIPLGQPELILNYL